MNVLREALGQEAWDEALAAVMDEVMAKTRALGGLPSGEHGIGVLKKAYLTRFLPGEHLELMARIKAAFDPLGILNPSKIL